MEEIENKDNQKSLQSVAFGGGCFWCSEAVFLMLKGVVNVTSGYAGGNVANPTYEQVSSGKTGHAEVVLIEYDPVQIEFKKLLEVFFSSHDPTSLNKQGNDIGTQYRSILLYKTPEQHKEAENYIKQLTDSKKYSKAIVTEAVPLTVFYPAEEYHNDYYARHPNEGYSQFVIKPKIEKITKEYAQLLK
jgi:peptide-methionine (S)-S-oxide reductase